MKKLNALYALTAIITLNHSLFVKGMEAEMSPKNKHIFQLTSATTILPDSRIRDIISSPCPFPSRSILFNPPSEFQRTFENSAKEIWYEARKELKDFYTLYKTDKTNPLGVIICNTSSDFSTETLDKTIGEIAKKLPDFEPTWHAMKPEIKSTFLKEFLNATDAIPVIVPIEYLIGKKPGDIVMFRATAKNDSLYGAIDPKDLTKTKRLHSSQENDPDFDEEPSTVFVATQEFCEEVNKLMISAENQDRFGAQVMSGKPIMDIK